MVKKIEPEGCRHEWLRIGDIQPHPTVQRRFDPTWPDQIGRNFDPDCFGTPYVFLSRDGVYGVFDGQHRIAGARTALGEDQEVFCRIYDDPGLSPAETKKWLAHICHGLNKYKGWKPVDLYFLGLQEKEWESVTICGTLHQYGLRIDRSRDEGVICAVAACRQVLQKHGQPILRETIETLFKAWGPDPDAYQQALLRGLSAFCAKYDGIVSKPDLVDKLSKSGGPAQMWGHARDFAKVSKMSVANAVAAMITIQYNKGRSKNKLPSWES